ncbi:MAG: hypothetical protein NTY48_05755 [Candidatus Diapherotrites archaeon]|nr:hypothetical protein [Candidatus Diapherotrites archaeon]
MVKLGVRNRSKTMQTINTKGQAMAKKQFVWKKPHQKAIFQLIKNGRILTKVRTIELAEKYGVSIPAIQMTYYRLGKKYPELFPNRVAFGRRRLDPIVEHRAELIKILLGTEGDKEIRLPSSELGKRWGLNSTTVCHEARRVLEQLKKEGHKLGKLVQGGSPDQKAEIDFD